jgi:hypothetical protein
MGLLIDWYHLCLAASNHILLVFFISLTLSIWTSFKNFEAVHVQRWSVRCLINCLVGTFVQLGLLSWQAQDGKLSSYLILFVTLSVTEYLMSLPARHQKN